jgi:hypothetical protein
MSKLFLVYFILNICFARHATRIGALCINHTDALHLVSNLSELKFETLV